MFRLMNVKIGYDLIMATVCNFDCVSNFSFFFVSLELCKFDFHLFLLIFRIDICTDEKKLIEML